MIRRAAILSLHTSPLAQPGTGDGGGMNVYVRELVSALAQAGVQCRVYVRRWHDELPEVVSVEPGFEVVHVPAGPVDLAKEQLPDYVDHYSEWVYRDCLEFKPDVIHANYWLSGVAGRTLKQLLGLPLLTTFHTLARVPLATAACTLFGLSVLSACWGVWHWFTPLLGVVHLMALIMSCTFVPGFGVKHHQE